MGSLRHDFGTQSELVVYAMRLVIDRIRARIEPLEPASDRRWWVQSVLEELLPLDADRRAESEVWLAFTGRALVDPALRALRDESYDLLRALCQRLVSELAGGLDIEVEAERLYAVVDGLLVHAVMRPDLAPPALVRRVLGRHLDSLA
jgi:AcrR family transcriptional regulator